MLITHRTCLNMVIGYPLEHTQSPLLHNAIYQTLNINAVFLAFANKKIRPLVQVIKTLPVGLTAITMPFKQKILPYLDHCSPETTTLGAANTLINRDGKLFGYNTDVDGIAYALRNTVTCNKTILVIGAGGAARAMGYFLQQQGAKILWLNRTVKKVIPLAKLFGGKVITQAQAHDMPIDIIVNTTPLGMHPHTDITPLPYYIFKPQQTVFDMVYNPVNTLLLKQAKKRKAKTISGLDMFIGQGIKQIELWAGKKIPIKKIIATLEKNIIKNQHVMRRMAT